VLFGLVHHDKVIFAIEDLPSLGVYLFVGIQCGEPLLWLVGCECLYPSSQILGKDMVVT
jgi:hypothetical protein